ncbi:hypothetical protein Ct61P_14943 [Colletotrichum tofieldiae]|nr:hypothetical protein Ct61P_14943 [Colletotrichum tofieldiae]
MPSIIDGRVSHRPYTRSETATRITHLFHNPRLLTPREVVCGIYLAYVAYVALLTLRSLGFLIFEADGREMCAARAGVVSARVEGGDESMGLLPTAAVDDVAEGLGVGI